VTGATQYHVSEKAKNMGNEKFSNGWKEENRRTLLILKSVQRSGKSTK